MSAEKPHAARAAELHARLEHARDQRERLARMVDPGMVDDDLQALTSWAGYYLGLSMAALAVANIRQATDALAPVEDVIDSIEAAIARRFGHDLVTGAAGNVAGALLLGAVVPPATLAFRLGRALDALYDLLSAAGKDIFALQELITTHQANRAWHHEDLMRQLAMETRWEGQRRRYQQALQTLRGQIEGRATGFYRGPKLRSLPSTIGGPYSAD